MSNTGGEICNPQKLNSCLTTFLGNLRGCPFEVEYDSYAQFARCIADETGLLASLKFPLTRSILKRACSQSVCLDQSETGMGDQKWGKPIVHGSHTSGCFSVRKDKSSSPHPSTKRCWSIESNSFALMSAVGQASQKIDHNPCSSTAMVSDSSCLFESNLHLACSGSSVCPNRSTNSPRSHRSPNLFQQ